MSAPKLLAGEKGRSPVGLVQWRVMPPVIRTLSALVCIVTAAPVAYAEDEIPLTMPTKKKTEPPVPVPALRPSERTPSQSSGLSFGVHVGAGFGTRGTTRASFEAALELGYQLPFAARWFGLAGWLGFTYGAGELKSAVGVFKSTVIAGELAALMSFSPTFGPGRLRVLLGPSFSLTSVRSTLGRSEVNDLGLALGLASRAGYLFTLSGCHHLGAEVGYHVRAYAVTGLSATDHVIVIAATYLWN